MLVCTTCLIAATSVIQGVLTTADSIVITISPDLGIPALTIVTTIIETIAAIAINIMTIATIVVRQTIARTMARLGITIKTELALIKAVTFIVIS